MSVPIRPERLLQHLGPTPPISIVSRLLVATLLIAAAAPARAQQPSDQMPIEAILMRLQIRVWAYENTVPDFFADERVVSSRTTPHLGVVSHVTDSLFRLRRESAPGISLPALSESRQVKAVDSSASEGESITGPAIFSGAFSSALLTVSMEMSQCFDYRIQPLGRYHRLPAIVIDYEMKPSALKDERCPGPEQHSGRAWIDPQTFQPQRIEMRIPNHHLDDGSRVLWTWSVEYAPANLEGKLFWLPKMIISIADANDGSAQWSFTATYRNYHKTNVTSRIITNLDNKPTH